MTAMMMMNTAAQETPWDDEAECGGWGADGETAAVGASGEVAA
jgi:hypothetical protein